MMKRTSLTLAAALALGLAGCGKNESATTTADDAHKAAGSAADAAAKTAEAAKAEAAKAADAAKAEAAKTAEAAKAEAARVADAAKAEAAKAAEAARVEAARAADAAKVEATKAANTAKTQGLIDKAKSLIAESKFSDASSVLQQLTGLSLTSDQQKLVDALKAQIQKALAAKATESAVGSVGDLLKK
jgi:hypothetical protein